MRLQDRGILVGVQLVVDVPEQRQPCSLQVFITSHVSFVKHPSRRMRDQMAAGVKVWKIPCHSKPRYLKSAARTSMW